MSAQYVSFPQRPPDEAVPAISKIYKTVHRRLTSIVSNSSGILPQEALVTGKEGSEQHGRLDTKDDINSSQSTSSTTTITGKLNKSQRAGVRFEEHDNLRDIIPSTVDGDFQFPNRNEHSSTASQDAKLGLLGLQSALPFQAARKASPLVQTETLTVLGDTDYADTPISSPGKTSAKPPQENSNSIPGFALQREISSESETPESPGSRRRPSLIREDSISTVLTRLKSGRLSKEFWMKDQNAHACFRCEAAFTSMALFSFMLLLMFLAFRRKHHCRLCGQIFCANCTILTSGGRIQQHERFRACKTCNRIMDEYADLSSDSERNDLSDIEQERSFDTMPTGTLVHNAANPFSIPNEMEPAKTPLMAIPATRMPFSERNMSKDQAMLELPSPPHQQQPKDTSNAKDSPMASRATTVSSASHARATSIPKAAYWGQGLIGDLAGQAAALNAFRRHASQGESRSIERSDSEHSNSRDTAIEDKAASEEEDDYWGGTVRLSNSKSKKNRLSGQRVVNQHRGSPYPDDNNLDALRRSKRRTIQRHGRTKSKSLIRHLAIQGLESPSSTNSLETHSRGRARSRSSSLIDTDAEDISLLGRAHLKALLHQLLYDASIDTHTVWEDCLLPILSKIAFNIKPKVKEGASGYINNYVKIKRIPGAKPSNCELLSGAIFTQKLAHKQMSRKISNPRILLVSFPLEYHRADASQLMSLEPVMAQEKEYLRNLVNRMMSLRPNLVFVEKSISGLALEFLLEANVAVAYNVKSSVISVISALTGADVITSVDRLAFQPRAGRCDSFEVKTFINRAVPEPYKKTYMFIRGCPPDLGCSVVLRGGDMALLEKIKRIMEFMVFVVYNLKLETNLVRDGFAAQRLSSYTASSVIASEGRLGFDNDALAQKSFSVIFSIFEHRLLSSSPGVRFPPPYLIRKAVDLESKLEKFEVYEMQKEDENLVDPIMLVNPFVLSEKQRTDIADLLAEQQQNVKTILQAAETKRLKQDLEHCKAQWKTMLERESRDHRDIAQPAARQDISVLFSIVCTATGSPCSLPTTEVIEFYKDSANDYSLGQYIEECVYSAHKLCPGLLCQRKNMEHHRSYVHAQARISIITESFACPLTGMQNNILMWSYCKICKTTTPLMPMSDNTWAYSFGKYLELSFYNLDLQVRSESCSHSVCRDHVRYFGFRDMAIRFDYDPVEIMGLALPQPFVDWQPDSFIRLKNDEFRSMQFKITAFYDSLEFRLYNMNSETLVIEQLEAYKADLTQMRQKAKDERLYLLKLLQEIFDNSPPLDYLCLNRALRATQDKVTAWNTTFDQMEQLYLPSEKDIRRLTTAHLRKLFSLDDTPRVEDEIEGEGKRSVSAPMLVIETETDKNAETSSIELPQHSPFDDQHGNCDRTRDVPGVVNGDRVISMPALTTEVDDEPRGFHPRRTYEQLIKPKDNHERGKLASIEYTNVNNDGPNTSQLLDPKLIEDAKIAQVASLLPAKSAPPVRGTIKSSTGDTLKPSAIPVFKSNHDPSHLRKKSLTNNHVLSKQIQDLGESIVGSVEKRWNEQKRFSAQTKDAPQRNINGETKVTSLAKHFEQLTREFEKERVRARKMLRARGRPTFAVVNQKPTVAVFDNVNDAVDELSDDEEPYLEPLLDYGGDTYHFSNPVTNDTTPNHTPTQLPASPRALPTKDIPESLLDDKSKLNDDPRHELGKSDRRLEGESPSNTFVPAAERSTLMKTLSNFWADRSSSNWTPLEYPLPPSEHMFAESDVVVREDEPSSLIAFTLSAEEYMTEMAALREAARRKPLDVDKKLPINLTREERQIRETLQNSTGTHMRFAWGGDKSNARLTSRIFYAEQFDALRRFCGCEENYISSLSRCIKWDSSGGKSGAAFLKTLDDRLIVKQMSKIETEQFLRFAPNYFEYMADNFFNKLPVSLCKILGYYQITSKNPVTGRLMKMDVIVMENLFYKRKTSRIFDLKGSMRNRKVQQTGRENEVLLDENFVELVSENPLFVRDHARRFLKSALHNDTLFLAQNNVMDYSLIIGIDEEKHELIVGIIDFIRTYTWDKKLESWVKERGLVGGGSAMLPTVVTPKSYKNRFREAMDRYIFGVGAST